MNIRIELDRTWMKQKWWFRWLDERIQQFKKLWKADSVHSFYKESSEYFLDLADILFFETDSKDFAHARNEAYEVKLKLYELEEILPIFLWISKSTITY